MYKCIMRNKNCIILYKHHLYICNSKLISTITATKISWLDYNKAYDYYCSMRLFESYKSI